MVNTLGYACLLAASSSGLLDVGIEGSPWRNFAYFMVVCVAAPLLTTSLLEVGCGLHLGFHAAHTSPPAGMAA